MCLKSILIPLFLIISAAQLYAQKLKTAPVINMVFTSDAHYGITRADFRGDTAVSSARVNAAMIRQINTLPELTLPADGGVSQGRAVGYVDYVVQTGDIANKMDYPIQTAAKSWVEFEHDYIHHIMLKGVDGRPAQLLLAPGNHDISNAIGLPKTMTPATDPTAMVMIYNLMLKPRVALTTKTYDYNKDKINYSFNRQGIHLMFITLWPDSAERIWMQKDLDTVVASTPVIIFTHDQPTCEAKHFTNPVPPFGLSRERKFENLVAEHYKESNKVSKDEGATNIEQRGWVRFLKLHPNIKAYFHGNSNYNEFYVYGGPDHDVKLSAFRVDSPMKGKFSATDETKLSFQLISINTEKQLLTVRECLWNTEKNEMQKVKIGKTATVSLKVN